MENNPKRIKYIQKYNFMWEEIQNHTGRNIKHNRKENKTPQEKKTKPCRKKHKTMQEETQNHAGRISKSYKKKYKTMQEDIQNHARRNTKYRGSTSSRRAGPRGL